MPQLQIDDFAPQLIWLAIIFALFHHALAYRALPRIQHVLASRKAKIEGDLDSARAAQQLADSGRHATRPGLPRRRQKAKPASARNASSSKPSWRESAMRSTGELLAKAAETDKSVQNLVERASSQMEAMTAGAVSDIVKEFAGLDVSDAEVRAALAQGSKE